MKTTAPTMGSDPTLGAGVPGGPAGALEVVSSFRRWLTKLDGAELGDADRVGLLAELERLVSTTAAAQLRVMLELAASQTELVHSRGEALLSAGRVDEAVRRGLGSRAARERTAARSVGSQLGLALRCSPTTADRRLAAATLLTTQLPRTFAALTDGSIGLAQAEVIVTEARALDPRHRAALDERAAEQAHRLSPRATARLARRVGAELDPAAVVARMAAACRDRRVSVRPAPDGMGYLTVTGPLPEVVGAYGALYAHATAVLGGTCPDETALGDPGSLATALANMTLNGKPSSTAPATPRGRGAIMADAALRWVAGRDLHQAQPVEVSLVMTDRALLGTGEPGRPVDEPAAIPGAGPVPAAVARTWLRAGTARRESGPQTGSPSSRESVFLRRLYTSPSGRDLVALDSRRRTFTGVLRRALVLRDQTCRTPWCDAPIRAGEHVDPYAAGGPTSHINGAGGCVRCNLVKEAPGWRAEVVHPGPAPTSSTDPPHTVELTTPTGHRYRSTAPPILGWGWTPQLGSRSQADSPLERHLAALLAAA